MNYESISQVIINTIAEHKELLGIEDSQDITPSTRLYGENGVLDSLSLVHLIVEIERAINLELKIEVSLSDSKAFSQERSPFRTIDSLTSFALTRLS